MRSCWYCTLKHSYRHALPHGTDACSTDSFVNFGGIWPYPIFKRICFKLMDKSTMIEYIFSCVRHKGIK